MASDERRLTAGIVRLLGGVTRTELREAVKRAVASAFREGLDLGGNDEPALSTSDGHQIGTGYRQTGTTPRDLSAISQERAIAAAYRLWNTHPLAKAITEIIVDYVLGDGATFQFKDERVEQAVLDFWTDPVNDMAGEGAESFARELSLFGEQLYLAFVRDGADKGIVGDGLLRLGPVDPSQIASVITAPGNRRDVIAIRLKTPGGDERNGPVYKVIRPDRAGGPLRGSRDMESYRDQVLAAQDRADSEGGGALERIREAAADRRLDCDERLVEGEEWLFTEGADGRATEAKAPDPVTNLTYDGDCFYFRVNAMSTALRGRPDMLPMIDWLDRFDQVFFDAAEHIALLNTFVWDLMIKGGSDSDPEPEKNLRVQARKIRGARPGSIWAHNEHAELGAKSPALRTPELEILLRQLRVFIAGGMRIPEHWVAEGGYTNRATAKEMGQPTYRMLRRRQAFVKAMFERIVRYQIDVLVALGRLPEEVDVRNDMGQATGEKVPAREAFELVLPDINVNDTNSASEALLNVGTAVYRLYVAKILPARPGVELLAAVAEMLGVEIDVEAVLETLEGAGADDAARADLLKALDKDAVDTSGDGKVEKATEPEPAE